MTTMKRPLLIALFAGAAVLILAVVLATHFGVFSSALQIERVATPAVATASASPTASPDQSAQERASRYNNDLKAFTARRPQK